MLGVGAAIESGAAMVLRRKFSASNFSKDCLKYKCTSMLYIGELCRYLVSAPPCPEDSQLTLRTAFGNGLKREVWEKFQKRFGVKHIVELYGSTEGNCALFNNTDKVGALGFVPRLLDFLYPLKVVKTDPVDKDVPYRDERGLCVVCGPNEPGLLVSVIDSSKADKRFDGYTSVAETQKKILTNVLKIGDSYFNTGDLMTRDEVGFFYFCDRVGDTFRW